MSEYMIRWKRNAKNQWYYLPRIFPTDSEAIANADKADKNLYRLEVVELHPVKVWGRDDSIQGQTVEPAVPTDG